MAIKSVNHRERDLALADRESGNGDGGPPDMLRERIARAKQSATITQVKSRLANRYKCECFERGWLAALAELEQDPEP